MEMEMGLNTSNVISIVSYRINNSQAARCLLTRYPIRSIWTPQLIYRIQNPSSVYGKLPPDACRQRHKSNYMLVSIMHAAADVVEDCVASSRLKGLQRFCNTM